MRLDKFLKTSRVIKRRAIANEACNSGRVSINGKTAKSSSKVKKGDVIEVNFASRTAKFQVLDVAEHVKKEEAKELIKYI